MKMVGSLAILLVFQCILSVAVGFYLPGLAPTSFCLRSEKEKDSSLNCQVSDS